MQDTLSFFTLWFPWFTFLDLSVFLQFFTLYGLYGIFVSSNLYYVLFYIILEIFFLGIFLSFYQVEIFTAFLWLTEVVIILVCLFILFNTTPSGNVNKVLKNYIQTNISATILIIFVVSTNYTYLNLPEYAISDNFLSSYIWDDFYEAVNNKNTNDLYGIFLSFYWLNSVEFLVVGLVLLIGSLICVQLNKFLKTNKTLNYISFFEIYDFFKDFSKTLFLRKQNLTDQENSKSSTRSFSKKNKK